MHMALYEKGCPQYPADILPDHAYSALPQIAAMTQEMQAEKEWQFTTAELKDQDTVIFNTQHRLDRSPWAASLQVVED